MGGGIRYVGHIKRLSLFFFFAAFAGSLVRGRGSEYFVRVWNVCGEGVCALGDAKGGLSLYELGGAF